MRRATFHAMMLGLMIGCAPIPVDSNPSSVGQGPYVAGSLQVVSRRAQNLLQSFGLTVTAAPEEDRVRLRCTTSANGHFTLVLTQANTAAGERTQVRLDWEDGTDDRLGIRILAGLNVLEGT